MHYISTRGPGTPQSFESVLLSGMAPDGGLFVPQEWPHWNLDDLQKLSGKSYQDIAQFVLQPFIGGMLSAQELRSIIDATYAPDVFDHPAIAPLIQLDANLWLMELFHGPTLSFKDYALQLVGRLFDRILEKTGQRLTIVGATSGDTGSAAIEACKGSANIDIFIMHPAGRTSEVQRRQMTSVEEANVFNIALDGTFDDCQAMVKAMFADEAMRREHNLSAVNSINWARIAGQMVYYVAAALVLGGPQRAVSFAVPTGNFGNVYAGWSARRMGLPVKSLTIGSNRNDILTRFFETGSMTLEGVHPSLSPSMDIQVSSNFERYLCDLVGRNFDSVRRMMQGFASTGRYDVPGDAIAKARQEFSASRSSDEDTLATMRACYETTGVIIDPHTAVGLRAGQAAQKHNPDTPMVVLACAHPAKFPDAVHKAIGNAGPVPPRLGAVLKKAERLTALPNDYSAVSAFVKSRVRGR